MWQAGVDLSKFQQLGEQFSGKNASVRLDTVRSALEKVLPNRTLQSHKNQEGLSTSLEHLKFSSLNSPFFAEGEETEDRAPEGA